MRLVHSLTVPSIYLFIHTAITTVAAMIVAMMFNASVSRWARICILSGGGYSALTTDQTSGPHDTEYKIRRVHGIEQGVKSV